MPDPRYKSLSIDLETYEKLARQAEESYRTIPAHIRYLVDSLERGFVQVRDEAEKAFEILEGTE